MPQTAPDPSTDTLLADASHGDSSAAAQLLERHRPRLRRMVGIRLDERLTARVDPSDVVQETIIEATRRLPRYLDERPIPFYPWLRQIAAERIEKTHRRHIGAQKRSVSREVAGVHAAAANLPISDASSQQLAVQLSAGQSTPSEQMIRKEQAAEARQALDSLAAPDREILALRHLEQLSIVEIAAILGVTETAAKSRHFRALRRLQQRLGETEDAE
jgi:RNA polymerase sigma-70 factor (ECF subfamily)